MRPPVAKPFEHRDVQFLRLSFTVLSATTPAPASPRSSTPYSRFGRVARNIHRL
ncbi:hypothetical protein KCP70_04285 [Salmonella enterica subsp. enterica]|nr:hypothetical protein KCP70_04285 [Salmonella enterica subsp. enterica]